MRIDRSLNPSASALLLRPGRFLHTVSVRVLALVKIRAGKRASLGDLVILKFSTTVTNSHRVAKDLKGS